MQTINEVMRPGAAKAVHSWLQDADEKGAWTVTANSIHIKINFNNISFMQNVMLLFVYLVPWVVDLQLVEWDRDRTLNLIPVLHQESHSLHLFLLNMSSVAVVVDYRLQKAEENHGRLESGTTNQSEILHHRSTTEERCLGEWGEELHTTRSIPSGQTTMAQQDHTTLATLCTSWLTLKAILLLL